MHGLPPKDMNWDNPAGFLHRSLSVLPWECSSLCLECLGDREVSGEVPGPLTAFFKLFLCQLGNTDLQENPGRGSGTGELVQHEKLLPIVPLDVPVFKRC